MSIDKEYINFIEEIKEYLDNDIQISLFPRKFKNDGQIIHINSEKLKMNMIYERKENTINKSNKLIDFELRYVDEIETLNLQISNYKVNNFLIDLKEIILMFFKYQTEVNEIKNYLNKMMLKYHDLCKN
ncbi:MAG: hypothetical protein A2Y34_06610 [Spirochaetes bacterium GWC1_27_15]|nr:MAG: hypothetical protein A2Z98_10130 [Spirochaetes bacterium GWB1_27_13]OHD21553.1 MAG: hypothetical protein A2Y34_06610 [Spirochaetes bacterium GWC1_27_15]